MAIKADRAAGESLALRLYNSRAVAMTETIIRKGVQWLTRKGGASDDNHEPIESTGAAFAR